MPKSYKVEKLEENIGLQRELQKMRQIQDLLKLASTDPVLEARLLSSS